MKKYLAALTLALLFTAEVKAVIPIFREQFAPNVSNPCWLWAYLNSTPVYQTEGPVTFVTGGSVLTIAIEPACCDGDNNPIAFEYEQYSVDGGHTWITMGNTWVNIFMPTFCTQASQIITVMPPLFDEGPMIEQVGCPRGG